MDTVRCLGLDADGRNVIHDRRNLVRYINLKLAALGHELPTDASNRDFLAVAHDLLANHREQTRLLAGHLCPADQRIQDFLDRHLAGERLVGPVRLPATTFVLDRHGLARELSLPVGGDELVGSALASYRIHQGILHNPRNDRRTTKGVFHVAEGGLPIPADKLAVPRHVFGNLLYHAMRPPAEHLRLPFTAGAAQPVELFVSLLLRPLVRPEIPGVSEAKTMEVRLFAPGSLVSNLDFVESIFGNAGDPSLPENDAALDSGRWTGHSGCVILAPHLTTLTKRELGLPRVDQASDGQRRDGMCWSRPEEPYNGGSPFKIACRTADGIMVTILADNYYGYCKKEVKTQISFSANLAGGCEEEHAGGAIAFASFNLGEEFHGDNNTVLSRGHSFAETCARYAGTLFDVTPDGYGVDRVYPDVYYMPESVRIELAKSRVAWMHDGVERSLPLRPATTFVHPSGYKVKLEKHPGAPTWRLVGTVAEGVYCHKPCTVSGGGKSEISKSINDAMLYGPIFIADVERDLAAVARIFDHDYSTRFLPHIHPDYARRPSRPVLDPLRSLGSVIKLLTPSPSEFTPEYNAWLASIPPDIRALAFIIKRFYRPEWGGDWRTHFSVDIVNGQSGHEFKYRGRKLVGSYLRVGRIEGSWRTFKLRQDFIAALKVPAEDDISVSAVVRSDALPGLNREHCGDSVKIVANCEYRFFQRPDDAIHRGYDKQAEADMASPGLFASNYQPLTLEEDRDIVEDAIGFSLFSDPMRARLSSALADRAPYVLSSAHPRIVDGKITKNPRYLQVRPDLVNHREKHLAVVGARLFRRLPMDVPVVFPVHAVLPGRRNNPPEPDQGIRELAVYGPLHYQELPELFVDLIASLSGKSPSTTGWGSEGALTKGPFNAVRATADLNNAIVSAILTGGWGFTTPAGHIGPQVQIDHDISLLVPEMWCRMTVAERDPDYLKREGHLERLEDFDHGGRRVLASRLGWRVTAKFVHTFLGRMFDTPTVVFSPELLRPELQDREAFAAGMEQIVESQRQAAQAYIDDGSIDEACPPLAAILQVMARGDWQGRGLDHPELRRLFTREHLLESAWYRQRLEVQQARDAALWHRHVADLEACIARASHADEAARLGLAARLARARDMLVAVTAPGYLVRLQGTIGADPMGQR
jgi:phosphoenolpyruvate carboxykinase (diphosphate)